MDRTANFINDMCIKKEDANYNANDVPKRNTVYGEFVEWMKTNAYGFMTQQKFYKRLETLEYKTKTLNGYKYIDGLNLRTSSVTDEFN